ncbi:hypothetical protein SRABI128_05477 [Microbacterium sp. Bi128]|nr:hypothetical protein SRABI128_05477 [Microbacterium sp. Bi128]
MLTTPGATRTTRLTVNWCLNVATTGWTTR